MLNIDKEGGEYWKVMPAYDYLRIMEELRRVRIQIFWLLRRVAITSGEDEVVLSTRS